MKRQYLHPLFLLVLAIILLLTRLLWTDTKLEYLFSIAGIFLTGIPHGAMDHHTASFLNRSQFHLPRYLLRYLASALLYLLVWFVVPGVAFLLFLILTAWHFGETDLVRFGTTKNAMLIFLYGSCLLMWLLLKDATVILYWTDLVTGNHHFSHRLISLLTAVPHFSWFLLLSLLMLFAVYNNRQQWPEVLLFLLFVFCAAYTSLLLGFVLYFAGWHSVQALRDIKGLVFKNKSIRIIINHAWPAVLGAFVLLFLIIRFGSSGWINNNGLPSLFVLLSVLTLPHMLQMHQLYQFRFRR